MLSPNLKTVFKNAIPTPVNNNFEIQNFMHKIFRLPMQNPVTVTPGSQKTHVGNSNDALPNTKNRTRKYARDL